MRNDNKITRKRQPVVFSFLLLANLALLALTGCQNDSDSGGSSEADAPPEIGALTLKRLPAQNAFTARWETAGAAPSGLSYELVYNESGTAPAAEASGYPAADREYTVSGGLTGGATYHVWVRSVLESARGPWSAEKSIKLLRDETGITFRIELFDQTRFGVVQNDTVRVILPVNTPAPWLFSPRLSLAEGAALASGSPASGAEQDFSDPANPVRYTVIAENGREQIYTVDMSIGDESGMEILWNTALPDLEGPLMLSRSGEENRSFITTVYEKCTWYVDGLLKGSNTSYRLRAVDYPAGTHFLTLNAYVRYGVDLVPWSGELVFTVTD
ncbi:fibronectin type III domain-containing protein [Treponema primitia]|uniref:fibronectin type III domain-containing protein n=1 Tax=Treponema primitia TaxID=88058 RepID=UPI00025553AE|nr:fibronectin type III domain-containing protein [Treponema primitia]